MKQLINKDNQSKMVFALTAVIEAITLLFRFGLKLESTKHTASTVGKLTMGIRIHHGYIGLLMFLLTLIPQFKNSRYTSLIKVIGLSLVFSDIIHHIILYIITGSADLDLVYPGIYYK